MSTATVTPVDAPANLAVADVSSVLLHGVSWNTYQSLRKPEENNHLRMTYDRGDLEIMLPLRRHGKIATLLDRMIYEWTRCIALRSNQAAI